MNTINQIPVKATSADDLSNLLCKSIEYEHSKKQADALAAENAILHNQLIEALDLFERRFESDPSQFIPGEYEWYTHAAITISHLCGRAHIAEKVAEARFNSIMGE